MKLIEKASFGFQSEPFVALMEQRSGEGAFILRNLTEQGPPSLTVRFGDDPSEKRLGEVLFSNEMRYIAEGDIVRLSPIGGDVRVLYRRNSRHNFLFFTERCNSRCLMCSQPPIDKDDADALTERNLKLIDLMTPAPDYFKPTFP